MAGTDFGLHWHVGMLCGLEARWSCCVGCQLWSEYKSRQVPGSRVGEEEEKVCGDSGQGRVGEDEYEDNKTVVELR